MCSTELVALRGKRAWHDRRVAHIALLHGPNLNLLGKRQPQIYGRETLADVEKACRAEGQRLGIGIDFAQSNHEGVLVDLIQAAREKHSGIVINAGAYTHTSIALHDALVGVQIPAVEVHISNVYARERFRHHSFIAKAAFASLCGFGIDGYRLAITGLAAKIGTGATS